MHAPQWYETPASRPGEAARLPGAEVALFTSQQIALATFFGSALAGSALLGLNELRLGRPQAGALSLLFGVFGTAALVALALVAPEGAPVSHIFGIATILLLRAIAEKRQGAFVGAHLAAGGKKASSWAAFGVGVVGLVLIFVPVFVVAFALELVRGG